jgi:hypothetical protein
MLLRNSEHIEGDEFQGDRNDALEETGHGFDGPVQRFEGNDERAGGLVMTPSVPSEPIIK